MNTFRIWPIVAGLCLLVSSGAGASYEERPKSGTGPSHAGGVLFAAVVGELPRGSLVGDCLSFPRPAPEDAEVELPTDGVPRVCVVYAAFPEGDPVDLAGMTFGIEYDEGLNISGYGYCPGDGLLLSTPDWPKSGAGMGMTFLPHATESIFPVIWFILSAGEGAEGAGFRLVPHPMASHGGRFANYDPRPYLEPISAYGHLRAGVPGFAPSVGTPEVLGVCCLDECYKLTAYECAYYSGLFLGDGKCSQDPCVEDAELGACCFEAECELMSRQRCYRSGGDFAGEGSTCEETPCDEAR